MTEPAPPAAAEALARAQVTQFVELALREYGIEKQDLRELREDFRWLRQHRKRMEQMGAWTMRSIVTAAAAAALLLLWEGFKGVLGGQS